MEYRREIDGLRALAVLPVILFHAGFQPFSGGFVGVDIFFVISGYLITSIILPEIQAGTFSLIRFYERRARRILPALFLVMFSCWPFAWLWLLPRDMKDFSQSLVAVSAFSSNVFFLHESGYFDTEAELKPLLHTWSLAVEEQYYILFPIFMILARRLCKPWIKGLLVVIAVISLVLAQWGAYNNPAATFFLLPTRGWELVLGALVAFYFAQQKYLDISDVKRQLLSGAGLLLITYSVFSFSKSTPFPGIYALVPTIGAVLIIIFASPSTVVGKLLGSRIFVGVGLVSYSAYLWHQPLFAFARYRSIAEPSTGLLLLLSVFAIVLAYFSWRFVEQPFRRGGKVRRQQLFLFAGIVSLAFISVGLVGHQKNGFEKYYVRNRMSVDEGRLYSLIQQHTGKDLYKIMVDDGKCHFWARGIDSAFEKRFLQCEAKHGKALVVVGDSHAMNIYNIFAKANNKSFVVGISQGGCRPYTNNSSCHYDAFDTFVARNNRAIQSVIFHQSGSYLFKDRNGNVDSQKAFDTDAPFIINNDDIRKIGDYLGRLGESVDVIWLGPFVEARIDFANFRNLKEGAFILDKSLDNFGALEKKLKDFSMSEVHKYRYVSLLDVLKIDRSFLIVGQCITYNDTDHFSECGEDLLAARVAEAFKSGVFGKTNR